MTAKDLLTALNDIDPKLLEDVEPWGAAPKTIRRHPVWAVAAALALCLGIGTAVVLLTGQLSLVSPEGGTAVMEDSSVEQEGSTAVREDVPDIQYEEVSSEDWIMQDFETWDYPEITLHRPLTQEETALMAAQELLPKDMDFAYLGGEAGVDDQGQTHYVTFEGWREIGEQYRASGCAFRITVAPDGIPSSPAGEILHVLDGPNNEIDGVEIYAANMTLSTSTAISGKIGDSYTTTDYCLGFLLEGDQPLGVTIQSTYCHDGLPGSFDTAEDAQYFAAYVLQQILEKGISTEGISGREPEGTYNSPYIFDYAQDARTVEATPPEDASSRELATSEIANLLGYEEWWATSLFSTTDFSGSAVYDSSGALWQASFTGYQHGTEIPVIHMAAAPGGLPPCCQSSDVPWNNQLGNTPIYSASQKDGEEETFSAQAVIGSGEDAVGVYLDIVSDGVFFDTVYAQSFLYDTMRNLVRDGVDLSRLTYDTASPTLTFAENPGPELSTGWDVPEGSATREMTQAELDALWGQELRDLQEVPILTGQVATNGTGEVIRATVRGYASAEAQSQGLECFSVHLVPDGPAVSDALDRVSFLEEPNNQVQGVGVYAAALESTRGQELPVTWYSAAFLTAGEAPVGVAVSVAQGEWGCSTKYGAEDLVARAVGQYIQEGVSLDTLAAGDSGGLELSFTPRPATDNTFSNVWNTFTTLYLEPQNLEVHGAQPDYTLTEEELASLWEDAPPWESFLTENDTVEAYGYFSDTGQLIKIFIGGYRDSPEIPGTQAYQLFSVCLYNSSLSGAWGQDVEAVLALADTTFQGVDIATERTDSTETYEDGSTMDFTCYSAAFQPSGGPTLATVDGFYSPVALTHEEARDFVERATEEILTHGVDMSGITGSP